MVTSRSKLKAKLDRPKDDKPDLSKKIVRFIERDDSLTPNYRVLLETTEAQMVEDFKLVGDPRYQNRFSPISNCFSAVHNREVSERRLTKKQKALEAKQKAEERSEHNQNVTGVDSRPSHDDKGTGTPEASPTFAGRPPRIISGSKRSIWGGRDGSKAMRAWDEDRVR